MNLQEIEKEITQLKPAQLKRFADWFDEYRSQIWDDKINKDVNEGKLDDLILKAQESFLKGEVRTL